MPGGIESTPPSMTNLQLNGNTACCRTYIRAQIYIEEQR